jgi:hypothetical protein
MKRKELIDFMKWLDPYDENNPQFDKFEDKVDEYLKLLNYDVKIQEIRNKPCYWSENNICFRYNLHHIKCITKETCNFYEK